MVLCALSMISLVLEEEAVEEEPSEEPSVLSVLCILVSRSDRRREGVVKFSSFVLLRGILMARLPGGYAWSVMVFVCSGL